MRQIAPILAVSLLQLALATTGCAWRRPVLEAARVDQVPLPNGIIEPDVWGQADPVQTTALHPSGIGIPVRIHAIHDGRALSLLVSWPDRSESSNPAEWIWTESTNRYELRTHPVDELSVLWPISPHPTFAAVPPQPERYDFWRWRADWSNRSGYADDMRLVVQQYPKGTDPVTVAGDLYPVTGSDALIEQFLVPDSGVPGTRPTPRPLLREKLRMPGLMADLPLGSQADVQAMALYTKVRDFKPNIYFRYGRQRTPGYWFSDELSHAEDGFWFVELYRLLVTPFSDEDAPLRGDGPHPFAVWVLDEGSGPDPFRTGPIHLRLSDGKPPRQE